MTNIRQFCRALTYKICPWCCKRHGKDQYNFQELAERDEQEPMKNKLTNKLDIPQVVSLGEVKPVAQKISRKITPTPKQQKMEQTTLIQDQITQLINDNDLLQQHIGTSYEAGQSQIDFTKYIEKQHAHYNLLREKLALLNGIFNIEGEALKPQSDIDLQVKVKQSDDGKRNIYCYTYDLPTTISNYQSIQTNFELQKNLDANLQKYEVLQQIDSQTKVIYLCYKKFLVISSRDFIYIRYNFKHNNQHWSISTSLPDAQPYAGKVRGNIILTATRIIPKQKGIKVAVYSQTDMKISLKAEMTKARGVAEIKKYLNKTLEYIKEKNMSLFQGDQLTL